jgi:hypothetical protein
MHSAKLLVANPHKQAGVAVFLLNGKLAYRTVLTQGTHALDIPAYLRNTAVIVTLKSGNFALSRSLVIP